MSRPAVIDPLAFRYDRAVRCLSFAVVAVAIGCAPGTATPQATSDGSTSVTSTSVADESTSTSAATSSSTSDTTDADSTPFIMMTDGAPATECDVWAQDCPRGEKCVPWAHDGGDSWTAMRCSPIADDPRAPGDACTVQGSRTSGIDDCALGSMCFHVDPDTNVGECVALCGGSPASPSCANACERCAITADSVLTLCLLDCDPIQPTCNEGHGCYPTDDVFSCMPDASGESGALGEACSFDNACDPGFFCANADAVPGCEGIGCCAPFCDTAIEDTCDALVPGTACVPWYERGHEPGGCLGRTIGACVIPP